MMYDDHHHHDHHTSRGSSGSLQPCQHISRSCPQAILRRIACCHFLWSFAVGITAPNQYDFSRSKDLQLGTGQRVVSVPVPGVLLKASWPTTPARVMAGAARLQSHHGSSAPAAFNQSLGVPCMWRDKSYDGHSMSTVRSCSGISKAPFQEGCGGVNVARQTAIITGFCRACQTSVGQRVRFPHRKGKASRMCKLMKHDKDGPRTLQPTRVAR